MRTDEAVVKVLLQGAAHCSGFDLKGAGCQGSHMCYLSPIKVLVAKAMLLRLFSTRSMIESLWCSSSWSWTVATIKTFHACLHYVVLFRSPTA